ncbi:MAG: S-adenosylmethionine decarboxylase [Hyphomicrobiales bacterium]
MEYKHIEAQIHNYKVWTDIYRPVDIYHLLDECLEEAEFVILDFTEHHFPEGGYTAVWLLAESHLAVHTFMPEKKTYIELSGCNNEKTNAFIDIINSRLNLYNEDSSCSHPYS